MTRKEQKEFVEKAFKESFNLSGFKIKQISFDGRLENGVYEIYDSNEMLVVFKFSTNDYNCLFQARPGLGSGILTNRVIVECWFNFLKLLKR